MTTPSLVSAEGTLRPLVRLVVPALTEQLLHVLVFYVDMWLAGKFLAGEAPLAAINLASYVMWLIYTLFAVVAVGAMAMTARCVGAGDHERARRITNQALLVGALLAAGLLIVGLAVLEPLVTLLQLEGEAHRLATSYLKIVLPALPAIMLTEVAIACLRGAGDMVSGLVIMAIVNTVNVLVGSSLLLGLGPLPALGWEGLAYGTAAAEAVGGLCMLGLLLRGRAGLRLGRDVLRPDRDLIGRMLRIGIPGGADAIGLVLCHLWFLSIVNSLGTVAAAAHGIGVRIEALAYMPGTAFSMAAATLAGQFLGARDPRRAGRSVAMACAVGGGVMVVAGAIFYWAAVPLSEFFHGGQDTEVTRIAARLVRLVAFFTPANAMMMILSGGLRGAGDTRWPLLFTFIGFLGVRIPLAYLLACGSLHISFIGWTVTGYAYGVLGAWYAMVADVVVRCALVVLRFRHGGWKRIEV